MEQHQQ